MAPTDRLKRLLDQARANKNVNNILEDMMQATQFEKQEYLKIVKEVSNRECEALRLYQPLPFQEAYHSCAAKECLCMKGNRAGGAQPLNGLVLTVSGWARMGDLEIGDVVIAGDGSKTEVTHIHDRGWMPVYRITFDDGATAVCTGDHLWMCKMTKTERFPSHPNYRANKWGVRSLDEIRMFGGDDPIPRERALIPTACVYAGIRPVPLDPYTLGVLLGDGSISQDSVSFTTEDEEIADNVRESCDTGTVTARKKRDCTKARQYGVIAMHNCTTGKPSPVKQALKSLGLMGCLGHEKFIPEDYLWNTHDVRLQLLRGLMDTDGYCDKKGHCYFYSSSPQLCNDVRDLVRSLGGKATVRWRETDIVDRKKKLGAPQKRSGIAPRKKCLNMGVVWIDMASESPFGISRKTDRWGSRKRLSPTFGRFIEKIEPCGNAPCRCITVSHQDGTYVMENFIVTHNSMAGFAEDARAVTAQDPYNKYPKRDGICVCLGFGEKHIGRVIHKFLFRAGSFKIIRDLETKEWRVFKPWSVEAGGDAGREDEAKPAPPLIPPRYIDEMVWESRGDRVFSVCRLTTGWEIYALNSAGDPSQAQGFDVNLYHIDEDTATVGWYEEAIGRTAIPKGLIRWTALPHSKNDDILGMVQRAEDESHMEKPTTVCIRASMFDNPYYPEESRQANLKIWAAHGEDVVRKRAYGEMVLDSKMMYPSFNKWTHDIVNRGKSEPTNAQRLWEMLNFAPAADWCLDLAVDPGYTIAAVAFIATPPPGIGNFRIVFDELYISNCTARILAHKLKEKIAGRQFQRFIIDAHGARLTDFGSGISPREQYEREMELAGVKCNATSNYFINGSDNIKGREECLRTWLNIRSDGSPMLYVDVNRCPNLTRELERFKKKEQRIGGQVVILDEANRNMPCHAIECVEYLAAHGVEYVAPRKSRVVNSLVSMIMKGRKEREMTRQMRSGGASQDSIVLGPRGSR